jgi:hypothetical protein
LILAWLLHAIYSTIFAFVFAHFRGQLTPGVATLSLLFGTYFGFRHARILRQNHPDWRFSLALGGDGGILEIGLTCFVIYAAVRHFMWMFFLSDTSWATLSANNFGDLPLHINYIRAFANGISFPAHNPIFASELLKYPYGPDLYNALWEIIGVPLPSHLFFTGVLATLASLVLLRSYAGWWGVGAFFLSGGLIAPENTLQWKNLLLAVFITQRGVLFALPLGLLLIISTRRHFAGEAPLSRKQMTILGVLWGFLPLFHLHAFVAVSLMMAGAAMERESWAGLRALLLSRTACLAYVPASLFILFSTDFLHKSGIAHWAWGWTAPKDEMGSFLVLNFGAWLLLPVAIAVAIYFARSPKRALWFEFAFNSFLFLLFFNLILAPWDWDNIKLLIWPFLGFARLAWITIEPRLAGGTFGDLQRGAIACALFVAGFVSIVQSLPPTKPTVLYTVGELASVEGALDSIPKEAVFAAAPIHNHPLSYFGRMRAVGYQGHLWSHGIKAEKETLELAHLVGGFPDWQQAAQDLKITHIFWGPEERAIFGATRRPWMDSLTNVSRVKDFEIYDVNLRVK